MATTRSDVRGWLKEGIKNGASHVIIACDTFEHTCYPVYIQPGFDPRSYPQRTMECYDLALPIEDQLNEPKASHWNVHEVNMSEQTYEELKAEEAAKQQAAIYETLEDDIMQIRSDVRSQAELLLAMDLPLLHPFLSNVLKLETLQRKYDEWCEEEDDD